MPLSFPPGPDKYNGILRYLNYHDNSTLNVSYSSIDRGYPHNIYGFSPLDVRSEKYFQTLSYKRQEFYSVGFKKKLLITHVSLEAKQFGDVPWHPYNWSIAGCLEGNCHMIAREPYNDSLNALHIKRFPVVPGLYDNITFYGYSAVRSYWTLNYFDVFGFICNSQFDCNGSLLMKRCTGKRKINISPMYVYMTIIFR